MSRQACQVPFCRRSRADDGRWAEWVCAAHWRTVDPRLKALRRIARRRGREQLDRWLWREAKRQAVERAMGL